MELRGDRARTFVRLRRLLERGVVTGGDADEAMHGLMTVFGAQSVVLAQDHSFARWNAGVNVNASWIALHTRYADQDRSRALLEAAPRGETYLIDRDATAADKDTDVYHHLRDQGYRDGMIGSLYNPFVSDLAIVLYREAGHRPFGAVEDELFRTIYPHLAGALAARRALAAVGEPARERLAELLPRLAGHAYVSYPSRVVTWSPKARALWRAAVAPDGAVGWANVEALLLASAAQFQSPMGGRSQRVLPGIRVEWASVPPERGERRRLLALMLVEPAPATAGSPVDALLTARQRVVARRAVDGLTAREIATELRISSETVRWTLREIYRRLRVHGRAELAALCR